MLARCRHHAVFCMAQRCELASVGECRIRKTFGKPTSLRRVRRGRRQLACGCMCMSCVSHKPCGHERFAHMARFLRLRQARQGTHRQRRCPQKHLRHATFHDRALQVMCECQAWRKNFAQSWIERCMHPSQPLRGILVPVVTVAVKSRAGEPQHHGAAERQDPQSGKDHVPEECSAGALRPPPFSRA